MTKKEKEYILTQYAKAIEWEYLKQWEGNESEEMRYMNIADTLRKVARAFHIDGFEIIGACAEGRRRAWEGMKYEDSK